MKKTFMFLFLLGALFISLVKVEASGPEEEIRAVILQIISAIASKGQGVVVETEQQEQSYSSRIQRDTLTVRPAAASALQTYFPLNNNDVKYYEVYIYGTRYTGSLTYSSVSYYGRNCYLEEDSADGSMVYYGYSGNEMYIYGVALGDESYPLNNPLKVANETIMNNGGSLKSSTTLNINIPEYNYYNVTVTLTLDVTINLSGSVPISIGTAQDCRSVDMVFTYSIPGESESLEIKEAWVLAPDIGKLRVGAYDEIMIRRGWFDLTGGTVSGKDVLQLLNPLKSDFRANPLTGTTPLAVQFTDLSTGQIDIWLWDFGDGTTSAGKNPTHTYAAPGTYTVSLTISGISGGFDSETKTEYILAEHSGADLNNDQKVDLLDAILALQILVKSPHLPEITMDHDINGDNRFGLEEALYVLQHVSGIR